MVNSECCTGLENCAWSNSVPTEQKHAAPYPEVLPALGLRRFEFTPGLSESVGPESFEFHTWTPAEVMERVRSGLSIGTNQYHSAVVKALAKQWKLLRRTIDHVERQEFAADAGLANKRCMVLVFVYAAAAARTCAEWWAGSTMRRKQFARSGM